MPNQAESPPPGSPPGGGEQEWGYNERTAAGAMLDADIQGRLVDIGLRKRTVYGLLLLFAFINAAVILLIFLAYYSDIDMLERGIIQSDGRVISENVIMVLIGGAVVEVAALLFGTQRYLFPSGGGSGRHSSSP